MHNANSVTFALVSFVNVINRLEIGNYMKALYYAVTVNLTSTIRIRNMQVAILWSFNV